MVYAQLSKCKYNQDLNNDLIASDGMINYAYYLSFIIFTLTNTSNPIPKDIIKQTVINNGPNLEEIVN